MKIETDFDPADPGERQSYSFDFSTEIVAADKINAATWSLTVVSTVTDHAIDATPGDRISGSAIVDATGKIASQFLTGLQPGNRYRVQAVATTDLGETVSLYSHVACQPLS